MTSSFFPLKLIVTQEVVYCPFSKKWTVCWGAGFRRQLLWENPGSKKAKTKFLPTSLPVTRDGANIKTTKPNDRKVIFSKLKNKFTVIESNKEKQVGVDFINLDFSLLACAQIKTTKPNNRKIIFSKLKKRFTVL